MSRMLLTIYWLLLASVCGAEPILTASTEAPTKGETIASRTVVKAILAQEDTDAVRRLEECVQEQGLKKNEYHTLFRSVKVKKWANGKELLFVRPALEPYCGAFYGAHLFRYWLVTVQNESGRHLVTVLFANGGDGFEVLSEETNGRNDIATTDCTARGCATALSKFDGEKYITFKCILKEFSQDSDDMIEKVVNCREWE